MLFCTTPFVQMARTLVTTLGAPNLRIIEVAHPLGGLQEADVRARAEAATGAVLDMLGA